MFCGSFLGMVRLSELKSNVQNSRPIKIATALPDDIITQREDSAGTMEDERPETAEGEQETVATEARPRRRKSARMAEAVPRAEPEEKLRGKRQKDFDIAEQNESSDEENQRKERTRAAEEAWTQSQQKLLELALQQYPKGASDRWDKIAKCVPSKSKVGNKGPLLKWLAPLLAPLLALVFSMPHPRPSHWTLCLTVQSSSVSVQLVNLHTTEAEILSAQRNAITKVELRLARWLSRRGCLPSSLMTGSVRLSLECTQ